MGSGRNQWAGSGAERARSSQVGSGDVATSKALIGPKIVCVSKLTMTTGT